eukprot:Awhi_evm1s1
MAYNALLTALSSTFVLSVPQPDVDYHVEVDVCKTGMGGTLFQIIDGKKKYIRFFSYAFKGAELRWSMPKQELFGIKFALEHLQEYLLGRHFHLYTDNKALTWIQEATLDKEIYRRRFDVIGGFTFTITHVPGKLNVLPDRL